MKRYDDTQYENGTPLVCPVCGKHFKFSDDTKYICKGGYTCSWKCFIDTSRGIEVPKVAEETVVEEEAKPKRKKTERKPKGNTNEVIVEKKIIVGDPEIEDLFG